MAAKKARAKPKMAARKSGKKKAVVLLTGGNPQVAQGDGAAPVKAYIAALPGWKSDVATRLDALIIRSVHEVSEATMMASGLSYDAAHAGSLAKYGVSTFSVYHPEVIACIAPRVL